MWTSRHNLDAAPKEVSAMARVLLRQPLSPVGEPVRMFREILQVRMNDWRGRYDEG